MTDIQFQIFMDEQLRQTKILHATMRLTAEACEGLVRNGNPYGAANHKARIHTIKKGAYE